MRFVGPEDLRAALPMAQCIDGMADAMIATSKGQVTMPDRLVVPFQSGSGLLGLMPGSCGNPDSSGVKVVSIMPGNPGRGLPVLQGIMLVFDSETGQPAAIIDASTLTAIRTAAVSGLATRFLAREESTVVAILGCGVQAESHVEAMASVRKIERFLIWGRSAEKLRAFCARMSEKGFQGVEPAASAQDAVCKADIVCTVTSASEPVLAGNWVRPGTHVNLVGSHDIRHRECDVQLIRSARVFSDHTPSVLTHAGEIRAALEAGVIEETHIVAELGEVAARQHGGRKAAAEITIFKSLGLIAQDLVASEIAVRNATEHGLGTSIAF